MIPLLVEYSEDDNGGCGLGTIVLIVLALSTVSVLRRTIGVSGRTAPRRLR